MMAGREERVSVIIPVFNEEKYLERAVTSVLDTRHPALDIIIVDDHSTDQSVEIAQCLAERHPCVRMFISPRKGVSAARNYGMEQASGELIAFLDADDWFYPDRFEPALSILRTQNEVDGVYGLAEIVSEKESGAWETGQGFGILQPLSGDELLEMLLEGQCWLPSAYIFRKTLLARSGVFDESLSTAEDCHLWWRMVVTGRIVSDGLAAPVCSYYRHDSNTFEFCYANRINFLMAMSRFLNWGKDAMDSAERDSVRTYYRRYVIRQLVVAREMKEFSFGWKVVWMGIRTDVGCLMLRSMIAQGVYLAKENLQYRWKA